MNIIQDGPPSKYVVFGMAEHASDSQSNRPLGANMNVAANWKQKEMERIWITQRFHS
jgi:hypothetical protein